MANKIRKQIYLDVRQEERLKRIAAATGESEAAIIRRAIDGVTALGDAAGAHRPLEPSATWRRALGRMRRSNLTPRPGVKLFDRESVHERE